MSPQTLSANLEALRGFRSVYGVIFSRSDEIVFSDAEIPGENLAELAVTLDDISFYFDEEGRNPDQLAFGYDGGNLLIILNDRYRLVVLHHNAEDVDIIAQAAHSFLKDYRVGLIGERVSLGDSVEEAEVNAGAREAIDGDSPKAHEAAEGLAKKVHKPVEPTQPITPVFSNQ